MSFQYRCQHCDFEYFSPMGGMNEHRPEPGWMISFCGACGDLCRWAMKRTGRPEPGELVRRERPGEAVGPDQEPWTRPLPHGPGRSAARRARRTPGGSPDEQRMSAWAAHYAAMREVRDDDVLACFRNSVMPEGYIGDFRFESQAEMECRACTTKGLLRLFLRDGESCPRCHQGPLRNLGLWE